MTTALQRMGLRTCKRDGCENHLDEMHGGARYCSNACISPANPVESGANRTAPRAANAGATAREIEAPMLHPDYPTRRCLYCEALLAGKRSHARYCDDLCGRAYRDSHVHLSIAAQEFWKGVSSVSRPVRSAS